MPRLALPPATGSHRVAHIHSNVPGVMAEVNSVLAAHGVSTVEARRWGTRGDLGYALTDIGVDYPGGAVEQLRVADSSTVRPSVSS